MEAVNLTLSPVELAPVNGAGLLAAADDPDGGDRRELREVTAREEGLARAGTIALLGDPPKDRYDGMDRAALKVEADERGVDAARSDGRDDLDPTADDLRHALRVADTTGGESS